MSVTLLLGGTFDPIHFGHVQSASALMALFADCRTILVPSKIPPHRGTPSARPEQRLDMLQLAVADVSGLESDDCELRREGRSYTFDTLRGYRQQSDNQPLVFAMGADAWVTLPTWHRWRELCELAHLVIMMRPGTEALEEPSELSDWARSKTVDETGRLTEKAAGLICRVELTQFDVSATEVRQAIKNGVSTIDMLHPKVAEYIARHQLYLDNDSNE